MMVSCPKSVEFFRLVGYSDLGAELIGRERLFHPRTIRSSQDNCWKAGVFSQAYAQGQTDRRDNATIFVAGVRHDTMYVDREYTDHEATKGK